jgi:hypothetical protein
MYWMGRRKERGCVRDKRGTRLCVKRERLECHIKVTCDFAYREENRVARTQRRARRVESLDVLYRRGGTRTIWGNKMRICAGNASVQERRKKKDTDLGQTTQNSIEL